MPHVCARVRFDGDDGREKQIVAAAGTAHIRTPRRTVADAEVKQIQFGIISHRIPDRAAATVFPVFIALPRLRRHFQRL